jgi:mannose-6-phosphate isomerase-like protein (cupin superfamily)
MGEVRFPNADLNTEQTGLSHHRLRPGARQPFGHRHQEAEEVYVVLAGSGRVKLDDEIREVRKLDAIRVAPEVTRNFEASDEGLELLAFGPRCEGDGELLHGWWED